MYPFEIVYVGVSVYTPYSCVIFLVFKIVQIKEVPTVLLVSLNVHALGTELVQLLFRSFDLGPILLPIIIPLKNDNGITDIPKTKAGF